MNSQPPFTTVYIPSRSYGRFLEEAIESVLRQSIDRWELLLFDEASEDETADVIRNYDGHPQIRSFRTDVIGMPAINNLALREAKGEFIMRLDADDVLEENALLVLENALLKQQDAALAFPDYYLVDQDGRAFRHESRSSLYSENHLFDRPPNGACTLIRTSVLKAIGGYREDLGAQDGLDLWTKLAREHRSINIGLPLFYYRRHGTNLTNRVERIFNARKQIKRDAMLPRLKANEPIIAIIPCREHYDFETNAWSLKLDKSSLLERSIRSCLDVDFFDYVIVTCDNVDVRDTMARFDDPRLHFVERPTDSTPRSLSVVPTLQNAIEKFDPEHRGVVLVRYVQAPFVQPSTLEEAIATLLLSDADSAFPVEQLKSPVYRRGPYGLECLNPERPISTDFDTIYIERPTCLGTRSRNFSSGSLTGVRVANFEVQRKECFFVDSNHSLRIAQVMDNENSD